MKCKVGALMLMLLMCWASQSSAQAARANVMNIAQNDISITKDIRKPEGVKPNAQPQKLPTWLIKKIEKGNACTIAENQSSKTKLGEPYGLLRPTEYALSEAFSLAGNKYSTPFGTATATLSVPPRHGKVVIKLPGEEVLPGHQTMAGTYSTKEFVYVPEPNYYGLDKLELKVKYNGQVINVKYHVYVQHVNSDLPCENERDGLPIQPVDMTQLNSQQLVV
jgi:hypothetical protein